MDFLIENDNLIEGLKQAITQQSLKKQNLFKYI